jgi:uncharacterized membrane protein
LADSGVGIDVAPVERETSGEVAVEKVAMPSDIRKGQPIESRVVLNNYATATENSDGSVAGTLKLIRKIGQDEQLLSEQKVTLPPGKTVYRFRHQIDQPAVYTYEAEFTADDSKQDLMTQNNRASAFTHVRGQGRVLLIEDWENPGEFDFLVDRLRSQNIEVTMQSSDNLFTSLAELQGFDSVILANVPRSSGEDAGTITHFSDQQIDMLVRNTEQMGCGLVMLGGPQSFGVGGWANSELEKAMPVDFQIRNAKVQAVGALVLLMHASEMAQGNHWQKVTAKVSIEALGPMDFCGLIHWNGGRGADDWLWGGRTGLIRIQGQRQVMLNRLSQMAPGDMPQFDPAMNKALAAFNRAPASNASVKHMIIISDGDPSPPSNALIAKYVAAKIKISTVAIGTHGPAGSTPLQNLATATGGKYYVVKNANALPKIYQREARRIARPLIYEPSEGVTPQIVYPHEMLEGIAANELPPIQGFVMTTVKDNPLVEVSIRSPKPDPANSTVLASWTYGLGRTAVLTTDAGYRWADQWRDWPGYDKLFGQLVRWSMRPTGEEGKFSVATDVKDGKVQVVVTALDKDDEFINFLNLTASAVGPDLEPFEVKVKQVAPGRYVGEFPATADGSYFVNVNVPAEADAEDSRPVTLLSGVNVPYSAEYRDRETNLALLQEVAGLKPKDGQPGQVIENVLNGLESDPKNFVDTFRHNLEKASSREDVWPWVLLVACVVFFADVAIRRVAVDEWVSTAFAFVMGLFSREEQHDEADDRMARLRNKKAEVADELQERRAATRFDPQTDSPSDRPFDEVMSDAVAGTPRDPQRPTGDKQGMTPAEAEEESYTSRLLKAKKGAFKDKKNE